MCLNRGETDVLTGHCQECDLRFVATGYPALVKLWQDHLREHHHDKWVKS